jgi:hypothetical protein
MLALKRRVEEAEEEGLDLSAAGEEGEEGGEGGGAGCGREVVVRDCDLAQALHSLTPSLGPGELEQYRQLREHYEARGK